MYRLAHRGLSEFYPENTMLAFRKALDEDFDGIETDVQMTKDGVLVLLHDETIDRTSNGKGQLKSFTYKELLSYTFSNDMPYPEPIPRLDELLALMKKTDKILNIEIKGDVDLSACVKVVNEVRNFKLEKQVYFSSVSVLHLIRIRELMPDAYVAIISVRNYRQCKKWALNYHLDGLHANFKQLNNQRIAFFKKKGIAIGAWTIRTQEAFDYFASQDILFTFSNRPFKETTCV